MIITDIKKNKNAAGYSIFADGKFLFSLDSETILNEGLKKGTEVSPEALDELYSRSVFHKAKEKALRLLDNRAHSKAEIIRKVSEKYPRETATNVADYLENIGLLNDKDFALLYARELIEFKRFGRQRVITELFRRGIKREIIDEVLEEFSFDGSVEVILSLIEKRRVDLSDEKAHRRAFQRFLREGYSPEDIKRAFDISKED